MNHNFAKRKLLWKIEENFVVKASIGLLRFSKYFHDSASTLANLCAYFQAIDMYARERFSSFFILLYWLEIEVITIPYTSNFISSNKSSPKCCIKANSPQYDVWHIFSKKILFPPTCPHENLSPKNTVCAFATILKYDTLPSSNTILGATQ